ncbi:MAG: WbqC family protein [Candidatus Woesearchaeota archaeon]
MEQDKKQNTNLIVTIHQPNHLPYLGFFEKMANSDIFILYDNTQFKSEDFQNRNRIRTNTPQGWMWLTVPVSYKFGTLIRDVQIIDQHWRKTHWKSIEANYARAPYFKEYKDRFKKIYDKEGDNLAEFNIAIIEELRDAFNIKTRLIRASELLPDMNSKSTQALVDLCKAAGATEYLSGSDGDKYLKLELFEREDIKVSFQHYKHPEYTQVFPGFQKYMAAIDLLFNHGPESLKIISNNPKIND